MKPGRFEVPCDRCGKSRALEKSHCHALIRGVSPNVCRSCKTRESREARKKAALLNPPIIDHPTDRYVKVVCECGNVKYLLSRTVSSYKTKGIKPLCNECSQAGKANWQKKVRHNLPCKPAPYCTRCHGLWEGCSLYDECLTYASAKGWKGWICTSDIMHTDMEYCEIIDTAMIMEAFRHAVTEGFTPDSGYGSCESESWLEIGYGGSKPPTGGHHA